LHQVENMSADNTAICWYDRFRRRCC